MSSSQDGQAGAINKQTGRRLWLWWTLATTLSGSLVLVATNWFVFSSIADDPEVSLSDDNAVGPLLLFGCGLLFVGPFVGLCQGLALRFAGRSKSWGLWIVLDTVGVVIAMIATLFLGVITAGSNNGWIWIVVPGAILGLAQVLVLSRSTPRAIWWIPINWGSWVIAVLVAALVSTVAKNILQNTFHIYTSTKYDYPFYPPESVISSSVGFILGGLIFSALTGFGLIWLLQEPPQLTHGN